MKLDESLQKAFDTIQKVTHFDTFTRVPHPENLRFQVEEEIKLLHRLGMHLSEITGDPDGQDSQYASHVIRRYFGDKLGMSPMPEFIAKVPRFLLSPDSHTEQRTDPRELAENLGRMVIPQGERICIVSTKLRLLQKLLNLSEASIKLLRLAYVVSSQRANTNSLSCNIALALEHISLSDDAHRNRAISLLLDEPLDEIVNILTPPSSLKALRFLDPIHTNGASNLGIPFVLTDEFMDVLESTYPSHEALLRAVLEPEYDLNLMSQEDIPIGHLYGIFPATVAEAFECAVLSRPLTLIHIHAVIGWYTGGPHSRPSSYSPLSGRITLDRVREAIKHAAMDCCLARIPLDSFSLMRALYAASDWPKSLGKSPGTNLNSRLSPSSPSQ